MNKQEFNKISIDGQVAAFNAALTGSFDKFSGKIQANSIRSVCDTFGVAKSTVLDRFKKAGYIFDDKTNSFVIPSNRVEVVEKSFPDNGKTELENNINIIKEKLGATVKNFIEIGIILRKIQEDRTFIDRGYVNLVSFTEAEFGLSKNQTYNLISVANSFTHDGEIQDKYKEFAFSQLVEMVSMPEELQQHVSVDMNSKDIRKLKKQDIEEIKVNEIIQINQDTKNFETIYEEEQNILNENQINISEVITLVEKVEIDLGEEHIEIQEKIINSEVVAPKEVIVDKSETSYTFSLNEVSAVAFNIIEAEKEVIIPIEDMKIENQVVAPKELIETRIPPVFKTDDGILIDIDNFRLLNMQLNQSREDLKNKDLEIKKLKSKQDLSLAISILYKAWSNELDDVTAEKLNKQLEIIKSFSS